MRRKAFTLIELLIVIAIIGVLAGLIIATTGVARPAARDAKRAANLDEIRTALEMYHTQNEAYPAAPVGNLASDISGLAPRFISKIPIDPKNVDPFVYKYYVNNDGSKYILWAKFEQETAKPLEDDIDTNDIDPAVYVNMQIDCDDGGGKHFYCIGIPQ